MGPVHRGTQAATRGTVINTEHTVNIYTVTGPQCSRMKTQLPVLHSDEMGGLKVDMPQPMIPATPQHSLY